MSGTHAVSMGDRGRLVVPAETRKRYGLEAGTPLVLVETDDGIVVTTRARALDLVRRQLAGASLVDELLAERRAEAAREDRAGR